MSYTGVDQDAPDKSNNAWWWNVITFGESDRLTEIALCPFRRKDFIFIRHKHDNEWCNWYEINNDLDDINSILNTKIKNVSTGGSNDYIFANVGFWSQGHFQIHIIDNSAIYVSINVISTKNNGDWIFMFREAYRPHSTFYFDYYLGDAKYKGHINPGDGFVYFETLNTKDAISCSFCFPIK